MKKRGGNFQRLSAARRRIHIRVLVLLPSVFLNKIHPRRFHKFDEISPCLHIESVISVAVCGGLLEKRKTCIIKIDTHTADAAFPHFLTGICICIQPDAISQNFIRSQKYLCSHFTATSDGYFGCWHLTMDGSQKTRRPFGDIYLEHIRRK